VLFFGLGAVGLFVVSAVGGVVATVTATPAPHFLEGDATEVPALFAPQFGDDIQVIRLGLYERHAWLVALGPDGADEQFHANGVLGEVEPHRTGSGKDLPFPMSELDLAVVEPMIGDARQRAGFGPDAEAHALVQRRKEEPPIWRVFVKGPRDNENYQYDLQGSFLK
jgi:hypothetical protein